MSLLLKCPVLRNTFVILVGFGFTLTSVGQQPQQPQVKVNVLNVCSPSAEEQKQIASALERIPQRAAFSQDFEIDRGRSILDQSPDFLQAGQNAQMASAAGTSDWVRIRREFPVPVPFATVQYSFSRDPKSMVETLVFRVRDPKDLLLIAIEDSASAVTTPANMLATDTPTARIKLERFGQSSIVLARCSGTEGSAPPDQSAYEPLFQKASGIAAKYRGLLGVRRTVPEELVRVGTANKQAGSRMQKKNSAAGKPK
ncbi:MAG: hypothetical protein LAO09_16690 [Acidobacteriia bacterium]|nr:hypothetical protein [Terriglobia bacterium]